MKKEVLLLIFTLFLSSFVSAEFNLQVEKIDKGAVIISELNNPAVYEFIITNNGASDMAEIYSLVSVSMMPKGTFLIPSGVSKLEVRAYPGKEYRRVEGLYSFEYQLRGLNEGIFKDKLTFRTVSLRDVLNIEDIKLSLNDNTVEVKVKNNVNTHLENVELHFSSQFFDSVKTVSLDPFQETNITLDVNKDRVARLSAGQYPMEVEIELEDESVSYKGNIDYLEKESISVSRESSGFIVRENNIIKTNEGNIPVEAEIEIKKDTFSRLFTTFSSDPTETERSGLLVNYIWKREIGPDESLSVTTTTNYTFPFFLIILVVAVGFLVKTYTTNVLTLNKEVSFVKTKGGEFALKVILSVKARKHTDNIQLIDRLPGMAKLYEKFGRQPDRIDEQSRRLFWNITGLNKGEERVFSYIIYSKVRAVGRFELPPALAVFEKDGKTHEVLSNRAYFVSETSEDY